MQLAGCRNERIHAVETQPLATGGSHTALVARYVAWPRRRDGDLASRGASVSDDYRAMVEESPVDTAIVRSSRV